MSESAIRKERLRDYLARNNLKPSPFGVSLGFSASYIRVLLSDASPFGEKAARNIEQLAGMPYGYLDQAHSDDPAPLPLARELQIPVIGYFPNVGWRTHVHTTHPVPALTLANAGIDPNDACTWVIEDDYMAPTLLPGTVCVIDRRSQAIIHGRLYLVAIRGHAMVRTVQVTPDGYRLTGPSAETTDFTEDLWRSSVTVAGRVRVYTLTQIL